MDLFEYRNFGITMIRVSLGLLFFIAGFLKVVDPSGIIGMVNGLGFPPPLDVYMGFLVLLFELIFGLMVLLGFNVKLSVLPLIGITVVEALGVHDG